MTTGFGAGLIPVHSPLLRESWLVSFPPLSDMLKFSGYSRLIRGQAMSTLGCTNQHYHQHGAIKQIPNSHHSLAVVYRLPTQPVHEAAKAATHTFETPYSKPLGTNTKHKATTTERAHIFTTNTITEPRLHRRTPAPGVKPEKWQCSDTLGRSHRSDSL